MADERKKAIVEALVQQRVQLTHRGLSLQRELHPGFQLRKSLRKHPKRWAAAGAGSAFLLARLLRPRRTTSKAAQKRGLFFKTGKLIFTMARPALTAFAIRKAQEFSEARLGNGSHGGNSMLGGPPQK